MRNAERGTYVKGRGVAPTFSSCSAFRLPRSAFSRLPCPIPQKRLDPADDPPRIPPLSVLAGEHRLLLGQHDEQPFGERRGHPGRPYQRVVAPADALVKAAALRLPHSEQIREPILRPSLLLFGGAQLRKLIL